MQKKVTHLIIGLGKGGAETMLYQILKYRLDSNIEYKVISFGASHYYEPYIRKLGVPLIELSIRKKPVVSLVRAYQEIRGSDTLCCWMYHANLIGYHIARLAKINKIIWCIRHSNLDQDCNKKRTLFINKCCAIVSRKISVIAYNGMNSRNQHELIGYHIENGTIVDNGVDCEIFHPNLDAKRYLQQKIGINKNQKIVLSISRDHPIKDIPTFIEAFSRLHKEIPETIAVMCGPGISTENQNIISLCKRKSLSINENIFLMGLRDDIPTILAGCDMFVLHSVGEAFPNTLIQAMACGCVCVSTDVGDVKRILKNDKMIVKARDYIGLSKKMIEVFSLSDDEISLIKTTNRDIAVSNYSIMDVVRKYEELF